MPLTYPPLVQLFGMSSHTLNGHMIKHISTLRTDDNREKPIYYLSRIR
jgi:hypothetical protein